MWEAFSTLKLTVHSQIAEQSRATNWGMPEEQAVAVVAEVLGQQTAPAPARTMVMTVQTAATVQLEVVLQVVED